MRLVTLTAFIIALGAQYAAAQTADSTAGGAYLDASARELVRLARERRQIADISVASYKVLSKERVSVGLRGIRRDRLLYRREVAGRIEWARNGPGRVEVLGAREVVPVAMKNMQLPSDLGSYMPHLAFDPADNRMLVDWDDDEWLRHPLAANAEQYYKFRTGGTTSIQLPDGKVVRLIELEIIPRQSDSKNITGSFWLESSTHAVVQAAFKLARDIDIMRDLNDDDDDEVDEDDKNDADKIPGFLKPLSANVDYVTIQYGLYDLKWWMPRSVLFEGHFRAGMIRAPMQYERTYSGYSIVGELNPRSAPRAEIIPDRKQESPSDVCKNKMSVSVNVGVDSDRKPTKSDSATVIQCGRWTVTVPADTAALLSSSELPGDIYAGGEQLLSEGELKEITDKIEQIGRGAPSMLLVPVTELDFLSLDRMRYNRVEGLSAALVNGTVDYGALRGKAEVRLGFDLEPNFELAVERPGENVAFTLGGFRRLNAFDPTARPFAFGASASALLFGRDDADFYRSMGVELKAEPSGSGARWYALRLFAQKETSAEKETDFSLRNVFDSDRKFRLNPAADEGTVYGSELKLRASHGLDPDGLRIGAELYGHGGMGTHEFGRGALTLRTNFPLFAGFTGAIEGAAGVTSVNAPVQHLWYVGGSNTLRGYTAGVMSGETFWRGRVETGYGLPAIHLVAFSDFGWAGARDEFKVSKPLVSAGVGVSLMDGIVRLDLARGLRAPKGWALTLYLDGAI